VVKATGSLFQTAWLAPFGLGDLATTFGTVDKRGRGSVGKDNMGGASAAGLVTTAGSGIGGQTIGAKGGAETVTLTATQQASMSVSVTGNQNVEHDNGGGQASYDFSSCGGSIGTVLITPTATGSASGGGGAHQNMSPSIVSNFITKT
jgi:microcystin-dependent protein